MSIKDHLFTRIKNTSNHKKPEPLKRSRYFLTWVFIGEGQTYLFVPGLCQLICPDFNTGNKMRDHRK